MPRPKVTVNVSAALPVRGAPTATGTAMMAFSGGTGPTTPQRVYSAAEVTALYGSTSPIQTIAASVTDALTQGAPEVVLVRCAGAAGVLTASEWTAGLSLLTEDYNACAQVAIPGIATTGAHDALVAHAGNHPSRTVFLDAAGGTAAAALVTLATGYKDATGAERVTVAAPPVTMNAAAGTTRVAPASALLMGLAARGDSRVGHTNHAPAGDQQGVGAGVIIGGVAPVDAYTDADLDTLNDNGVSVIRQVLGSPTAYGWVSVSDDPRFHQLNAGRFAGQIANGIDYVGRQFLFTPLDSVTFSAFHAAIGDFLAPLRKARAIWGGLDDSQDGYAIEVERVNTLTTVQAGQLVSATAVSITPYTEQVLINVVTSIATEVGA